MSKDLDLKKVGAQYERVALEKKDLPQNPIELLNNWLTKSIEAKIPYANAATLSTISKDGFPSSRVILIKEVKNEQIIFFTNYNSDKAKDISFCPNISLNIYWKELDRQIRIKGQAEKTSREVSENYFRSRPFESQISAIVSDQSSETTREELEKLTDEYKKKYTDKELPFPEYWGGYKVSISQIEFWQGRPNRLHDRFCYSLGNSGWENKRLAP